MMSKTVATAIKKCIYCKSDYERSSTTANNSATPDEVCRKCRELVDKYGRPTACAICKLEYAFADAPLCMRCAHYQRKFGAPLPCAACHQMCAFRKDDTSRQKVGGAILCWVCTFDYKLRHAAAKRKSSTTTASSSEMKHRKTDESSATNSISSAAASLISNEQLMQIGALHDDITALNKQLQHKDQELSRKDKEIARLKLELFEAVEDHRQKEARLETRAAEKQHTLTLQLQEARKETAALSRQLKTATASNGEGGAGRRASKSQQRNGASAIAAFETALFSKVVKRGSPTLVSTSILNVNSNANSNTVIAKKRESQLAAPSKQPKSNATPISSSSPTNTATTKEITTLMTSAAVANSDQATVE